jgi:flagellar biosynthesis/type III secretory pathway M-ring protein FliF/YscJ
MHPHSSRIFKILFVVVIALLLGVVAVIYLQNTPASVSEESVLLEEVKPKELKEEAKIEAETQVSGDAKTEDAFSVYQEIQEKVRSGELTEEEARMIPPPVIPPPLEE